MCSKSTWLGHLLEGIDNRKEELDDPLPDFWWEAKKRLEIKSGGGRG